MVTPNIEKNVAFLTLSADRTLDHAERTTIEALIPAGGLTSAWHVSARTGRTYALFELPDAAAVDEARRVLEASGIVVTAYATEIIALAVFPAVLEALPPVIDAFTGTGRPYGVLASYACEGGLVVEWDPQRTAAGVVLGLFDVELRRFNSGRTTELLSPLSAESIARVAGDALHAPEIATDRILEVLLERTGLRA